MTKKKIIKISSLIILGIIALFLLYFAICHTVVGADAPTLYGVNVDYNTHFMGLYIMGICFFVAFLLDVAIMLFIIFYKSKPKKLKYQDML